MKVHAYQTGCVLLELFINSTFGVRWEPGLRHCDLQQMMLGCVLF